MNPPGRRKNAFNTIHRDKVLEAARSKAPAIYNYLWYAYHEVSPLFVGGKFILSQTGMQQGCPMGPVGFALGLQDAIPPRGVSVWAGTFGIWTTGCLQEMLPAWEQLSAS